MSDVRTLPEKMLALADAGHPYAEELRDRSRALTAAIHAPPETFDMKRVLGCWARARKLYCDASGEPLV
jgi:hypothetical protein